MEGPFLPDHRQRTENAADDVGAMDLGGGQYYHGFLCMGAAGRVYYLHRSSPHIRFIAKQILSQLDYNLNSIPGVFKSLKTNLSTYYLFMISDDQFRIIMGMAAGVPLSYLMRFLQIEWHRELYSIVMGTLLQYYVYGWDIYMVFTLHFLVYGLACLNIKKVGPLVTYLSMTILSIYHIYRMVVDYGGWTLDISTIIMTNVCKYSDFAYGLQDGKTAPEKLSAEQKHNSISRVPSIVRYLSFCQFVPTAVIGTNVTFRMYEDFICLKNQYKVIPSPWKSVGKDMAYSIGLMLVYLVHMFVFPLSTMQDPEFTTWPFVQIAVFGFFSVTTIRFKYYFAWKFSQGAVHASGITYNKEKDGSENFDLVKTCNPEIVQTTMHVRLKIANWNMTVQEWLRRCVYERSTFKSKIQGQLFTFLVSSFWHGYYGGYYISFFLWFSQQYASQLVFKDSQNEESPFRKAYIKMGVAGTVLLWISSNFIFSVSGIFFQVLSLSQSMQILHSLYYSPLIIYITVIVVFTKLGTKSKKKRTSGEPKDL